MSGGRSIDKERKSPRESGEDSEDESEILEESPCGRWLKRREEVSTTLCASSRGDCQKMGCPAYHQLIPKVSWYTKMRRNNMIVCHVSRSYLRRPALFKASFILFVIFSQQILMFFYFISDQNVCHVLVNIYNLWCS